MALHRSMEKRKEQGERKGERGEGSGRDSTGGGGAGMAKAKRGKRVLRKRVKKG